MDIRKYVGGAFLLGVISIVFLAWLWQPARQIRLHQQNLFRAYERRDWQKVNEFLDEKYADRWMHDKAFVVQASREVFGQYLTLKISSATVDCTADRTAGRISSKVTIQGQGGPVAEVVSERVNGLREPFVFDWVRRGRPWDWKLVRADQPELRLDLSLPEN